MKGGLTNNDLVYTCILLFLWHFWTFLNVSFLFLKHLLFTELTFPQYCIYIHYINICIQTPNSVQQLQLWVFLGKSLQQSFSHLDFGSLSHFSWQILSISARLDGKCLWTAIFRSLHRCSLQFKSGLWLGHSRTDRDLSRIIVFLKGEPSAQSEVTCTLEQVFLKYLSEFGCIHPSLHAATIRLHHSAGRW